MKRITFFMLIMALCSVSFISCTDNSEELQVTAASLLFDIEGEDKSSLFDLEILKDLIVNELKNEKSLYFRESNNLIQLDKIQVIEKKGESFAVAEWTDKKGNLLVS